MNERDDIISYLPDSNLERILKKSLERWKIYATYKVSRQRAVHKAVYSYGVRLKQKALNSLLRNCIEAKRASSYRKSISTEPDECPKVRAACCVERQKIFKRTFRVWRIYTNNGIERKSSSSYKCIDDRREISLEKKRNVELEKKAIEFHRCTILRKLLRLWLDARNERSIEKSKWDNAIAHLHGKLLRKVWLAWIEYCNVKIERANRIAEMREFYEKKLLARSLKILSSRVRATIEKRQKFENALSYYAKVLLFRVFHAWNGYNREKREFESKISLRREKIDASLKKNVVKQWRWYVWRKKCERRKNNMASGHCNRRLAIKTICSLKRCVLRRKEKSTRLSYLMHGTTRITLDILRSNVDKWRIAVVRIAQERQKVNRAEEHWRFRQMAIYFFHWKEFSASYKLKAERKSILSEIGRTVQLAKYTNLWLKRYRAIETLRSEEIRAETMYTKKIQSRLLRSWKRHVDEKIGRKMEIEEALNFHRGLLLREGLKDTLKMCLYKAESRYEKLSRRARKNSIEDFDIAKKFFARWLSLVFVNDATADRDRLNVKKKDRYEFSRVPMSMRLVLPEYMLRKMKTDDYDNYDVYEGNTLKGYL